jgi:hypothetical protein
MAVPFGTLSVTASAGIILAASVDRRQVILQNTSGQTVYVAVGNYVALTTANGLQLLDSDALTLDGTDAQEPIYGISTSGTATIRYKVGS